MLENRLQTTRQKLLKWTFIFLIGQVAVTFGLIIFLKKMIFLFSKILTTKEDLANAKAEIIKWMFYLLDRQAAVTFGFNFFILKKVARTSSKYYYNLLSSNYALFRS